MPLPDAHTSPVPIVLPSDESPRRTTWPGLQVGAHRRPKGRATGPTAGRVHETEGIL